MALDDSLNDEMKAHRARMDGILSGLNKGRSSNNGSCNPLPKIDVSDPDRLKFEEAICPYSKKTVQLRTKRDGTIIGVVCEDYLYWPSNNPDYNRHLCKKMMKEPHYFCMYATLIRRG